MSLSAQQPGCALDDIVQRAMAKAGQNHGDEVSVLDELLAHGFNREELFQLVVPRRTLARRRQAGERLSPEESDRAVRLARITSLAERVFSEPAKAYRWLRKPNGALAGAVPLDLLKSETGAYSVEQALHQIDYGIVA